MEKKDFIVIAIIVTILIFVFRLASHVTLHWALLLGAYDFVPTYIPFEHKEPYANLINTVRRQDGLNLNYEGHQQKLVFRATQWKHRDDWLNDPKILNGSNYYYVVKENKQIFEWQDTKTKLQFRLTYSGNVELSKEKFIMIANSVEPYRKVRDHGGTILDRNTEKTL